MSKLWLVALPLVALISAAWLIQLPGTTSLIWFSNDSLAGTPNSVGDVDYSLLEWHRSDYLGAEELDDYRATFRSNCAARVGLDAARCVSDLLAKHFVHSTPRSEMFDANYSPHVALSAHLNGAPGHCTVRAALTATMLLAVGIPARVVQVLTPNVGGHTLVEVFDGRWYAVDPSYGFVLGDAAGHALSISEVIEAPQLWVFQKWQPPANVVDDLGSYHEFKATLGTRIIVPEPWLYTRVGPHRSLAPYRALFIVQGAPAWDFGVQNWLATLLLAASSFGFCARAYMALQKGSRGTANQLHQEMTRV